MPALAVVAAGATAADAVVTEAAATEKAKLDAEKDAAFAKAALDADMRQGEGCGVQGGAGHGEGGRTGRGHEGRAGRVPGGVRPEVEPDGDGAECGGTGGTARAGSIGHSGISRRRWTAGLIRQGLPQRAARGGSQDSRAEKTVDPDQCPSCTSRRRASPTRGTSSTSAPSRTRSEGFDGWTSYSLAYHDGDDVGHSATIVGM